MKRNVVGTLIIIVFVALGILISSLSPEQNPESDALDIQVQQLLNKMTVEEKVGQMTQVTIDLILKDYKTNEIDEQKLRHAILDKKVGSILNVKEHAYTLDTWHKIIRRIQELAVSQTPNKIPILYGIDAIHGNNYVKGSTLFPHNIGMAATRDLSLVEKTAKVTAAETRATGIRWNFDPVLGLGRQPLWSRFEETFGEDVYLTSELGVAAIKAYQGTGPDQYDNVAACMKHFIGYSLPLSGKDRTPAHIPDNVIREYLLPPFERAVAADVATVMINSGEVNGVPVHASKYFLTTLLRDELGFKGVAVSDWEDVIRLHSRHHVADSPKEAVRLAIEAGLDMSMVPLDFSFYDLLLELVKEGTISEKRIDESVARILKLKYAVNLFEDPFPEEEAIKKFQLPEYKEVALEAAKASMTLLKNEGGTLPLPASAKVLLAGPAANNVTSLHGSWSYTWQGRDDTHYPGSTLTIKEAFENKVGKANVICHSVRSYEDERNFDTALLRSDAKNADYIVLCLGEDAYAESPGVIDDLTLDPRQQALAQAAVATGKPVILVLIEGRPRVVSAVTDEMKGILLAYRPASQGANAIVATLLGEHNPSGVLPFSYPKSTGDVLAYDHKHPERIREDIPNTYGDGGYKPHWPFGYGLSYTSFKFSKLKVDKTTFSVDESITLTATATNTGSKEGNVVVELYARDLYASVTPNFKRLKRFKKVNLQPGESKNMAFTLTAADLSFINAVKERVTEPGQFEFMIGEETVSVELLATGS
ncbi:beta-glucosidase [Fulvivirga sp. M361]|uniref:glycoside hydrolase family 3 N-terminal domain-containing protein n=1 Tax=Fulvivirga sp. M361 TaxID=2594266 RepID=UPI00117A6718|nr:glycoside hydrolase family 3 N-terminal domain-containing protein [Fulvivirga sp. M361]TRX61342.1 beta-glucosidase [Fulvivirga sp. M361]